MRGDRGWRECERGQGMEGVRERIGRTGDGKRERGKEREMRWTEGDRKRDTSAIPVPIFALSRVGMSDCDCKVIVKNSPP